MNVLRRISASSGASLKTARACEDADKVTIVRSKSVTEKSDTKQPRKKKSRSFADRLKVKRKGSAIKGAKSTPAKSNNIPQSNAATPKESTSKANTNAQEKQKEGAHKAGTANKNKYKGVAETHEEEYTEFERVAATQRPAVSKPQGQHRRRRSKSKTKDSKTSEETISKAGSSEQASGPDNPERPQAAKPAQEVSHDDKNPEVKVAGPELTNEQALALKSVFLTDKSGAKLDFRSERVMDRKAGAQAEKAPVKRDVPTAEPMRIPEQKVVAKAASEPVAKKPCGEAPQPSTKPCGEMAQAAAKPSGDEPQSARKPCVEMAQAAAKPCDDEPHSARKPCGEMAQAAAKPYGDESQSAGKLCGELTQATTQEEADGSFYVGGKAIDEAPFMCKKSCRVVKDHNENSSSYF